MNVLQMNTYMQTHIYIFLYITYTYTNTSKTHYIFVFKSVCVCKCIHNMYGNSQRLEESLQSCET